MSRAYRITVKESLSRHVQVEDGVNATLELLPILSRERMAELLAHELAQRGFERNGSVSTRRQEDGTQVDIHLETGEMNVTIEGHAQLNLEAERASVVVDNSGVEKEAKLRSEAKDDLERHAAREEAALKKQVTEKLQGILGDLKEELDGVTNKVTAAALKQRASELGQVEEVHEEANGNLTIKIRV